MGPRILENEGSPQLQSSRIGPYLQMDFSVHLEESPIPPPFVRTRPGLRHPVCLGRAGGTGQFASTFPDPLLTNGSGVHHFHLLSAFRECSSRASHMTFSANVEKSTVLTTSHRIVGSGPWGGLARVRHGRTPEEPQNRVLGPWRARLALSRTPFHRTYRAKPRKRAKMAKNP